MILTCQKGDNEDIRELETNNISVSSEKSDIYFSFDETMYGNRIIIDNDYSILNHLTNIDVA